MGFFKSTNIDWVKALIKEGISDNQESELLMKWAISTPDDHLNQGALLALKRIMIRTQRYLSTGGGSKKKQAKESARIAETLIRKITKK